MWGCVVPATDRSIVFERRCWAHTTYFVPLIRDITPFLRRLTSLRG
jgi:hypothetical protein